MSERLDIASKAAEKLDEFGSPYLTSIGTSMIMQAELIDAQAATISQLQAEIARLREAIDAAYVAMRLAIRLGQIDASGVMTEHPERQALRLAIFRALDMPLAHLGNYASPEVRRLPDAALGGSND